jgi:hypothetical protein
MQRTILSTLALAALLLPAATAQANTYDVYSCWAGSGTFRNPNASSAAWVKDRSAAGGHFTAHADCGSNTYNGAMTVISLSGYAAAFGEYARLAFTAPPGSTVERIDLWRNAWSYGTGTGPSSQRNFAKVLAANGASVSGGGDADGTVDVAYGSRGTSDVTEHGITPSNLLALNPSSLATNSVEYRVGCGWAAGCPTGSSSGPAPNYFASGVDVFGTKVTVADTTSPTLVVADSGAFSGGDQAGVRQVVVTQAADESGIKKLAVYADGSPTPLGILDFEQDVNRCSWFMPAPCQNVADIEVPIDTRQLADGHHTFVVKAFDAAGNEKASTTHDATIKNAGDPPAAPADSSSSPTASQPAGTDGLPNGVSAQSAANSMSAAGPKLTVVFDQNKKSAVKAKYGRMIVVRGRLDDGSGAAISSAQVDYSALASKAGARRQSLGSVRTDSNGEFFLTVATKLGSRQLRFAYRPQLGGAVAVTSEAKLEVVAPVSLKVGPKHVHNKHAVTFSGKLGAGPIPRKGKLVNLQVVVDGRWNTFATVRSSKSGKFKYRYRFKRTYGRAKYRFRALSRFEAAYPFVAGHSKTVSVRVN